MTKSMFSSIQMFSRYLTMECVKCFSNVNIFLTKNWGEKTNGFQEHHVSQVTDRTWHPHDTFTVGTAGCQA